VREPGIDAWTIRHREVHLATMADIAEWRTQLHRELTGALGGVRGALLIDLAGFSLAPALASQYGPVAKAIVDEFATAAIRFGPGGSLTNASIRTATIQNGFPSNICDNKQTAIALLAKLRGDGVVHI
jgi:hypothetical protein